MPSGEQAVHPGMEVLHMTQVPHSVMVILFMHIPQKLLTTQLMQFVMLHITHPPFPFASHPVPHVVHSVAVKQSTHPSIRQEVQVEPEGH